MAPCRTATVSGPVASYNPPVFRQNNRRHGCTKAPGRTSGTGRKNMAMILTRRSMICVAGAGGLSLAFGGRARAEAKSARVIYPTAEVAYLSQYVAARAGFFKEAGLDCKLIQGGSGVKMREIVGSG